MSSGSASQNSADRRSADFAVLNPEDVSRGAFNHFVFDISQQGLIGADDIGFGPRDAVKLPV